MKKKSIILITPLPPPVHGSSVVSQYILENHLLKEEFEMDLVNLSTSRTMEEIGEKSIILYLKKFFRFSSSYLKLLKFLVYKPYDLCYLAITCHGIGFLKDMPFVLLCKLFRKKIVLHQHNKGMSSDVNRFPYKWLLPFTYRNTTVILLSQRLYPDVEKVVMKDQILICPNGIPLCEETTEKRSTSEKIRLLYLSNLIMSKGVYQLLDACALVKKRGFDFICNFVGGETKEIRKCDFEKAVRERGLEGTVFYHGPKYGNEKEIFWSSSDVFVFPTFYHNECFPLVLLEAMQHKLACISTNEGGIPDIIEDGKTGLICEKNNSQDLANTIQKIIENPEWAYEMGQQSFLKYKEEFTITSFEERITQCIKSSL